MALRCVFLAFLWTSWASGPISLRDVQRARNKRPSAAYRGHSQAVMSRKLNDHLIRAEERSATRTLPCEKWSLEELQTFMAIVAEHRSHELQQIYKSSMDRRSIRSESVEEFQSQWRSFNQLIDQHPHLHAPQQEAHCREAVMWWVHHLAEEKRQELRSLAQLFCATSARRTKEALQAEATEQRWPSHSNQRDAEGPCSSGWVCWVVPVSLEVHPGSPKSRDPPESRVPAGQSRLVRY